MSQKESPHDQDALIEASFDRLPRASQQVLKLRSHIRLDGPLSLVEIAELMRSNISTVVTRLHKARAELVELCGGALAPPFVDDRAALYFGEHAWLIVIGTKDKVASFQRLPTFGPAAESAVAAWHEADEPVIGRPRARTFQSIVKTFQERADAPPSPPTPRTAPTTLYVESANDLMHLFIQGVIKDSEYDACMSLLERDM